MKHNKYIQTTLIFLLICLTSHVVHATPANGKVEFRTPVGGQPRVEIRIEDPDEVGPYWIFGGPNSAAPLESPRGATGNCQEIVTVTLQGAAHLKHSHYVVYNDCQPVPADEAWRADKYFSEWTKGERVSTSFGSGSSSKEIALLHQIRIWLIAIALLVVIDKIIIVVLIRMGKGRQSRSRENETEST